MSRARPSVAPVRALTGGCMLIAVLLLALPGGALAATKTEVRILEGAEIDGFLQTSGDVKTSAKCRSGRKIKFVLKTQSGKRYIGDSGRTTRNGAWGLKAKLKPNTSSGRVVVSRKQAGGTTCAKDSAPLG